MNFFALASEDFRFIQVWEAIFFFKDEIIDEIHIYFTVPS